MGDDDEIEDDDELDGLIPDIGANLAAKINARVAGGDDLETAIAELAADHSLSRTELKKLKQFNMLDNTVRRRELTKCALEAISDHHCSAEFTEELLKLNGSKSLATLLSKDTNPAGIKWPPHSVYLMVWSFFRRKIDRTNKLLKTVVKWPANEVEVVIKKYETDRKNLLLQLAHDLSVCTNESVFWKHIINNMNQDLNPRFASSSLTELFMRDRSVRIQRASDGASQTDNNICKKFQTGDCTDRLKVCPDGKRHVCLFCKSETHCGRFCYKLVPQSMRRPRNTNKTKK